MARRTPLEETEIDLGGRAVPVRLYRNPKARRLILRIDSQSPGADGVAVTLPRGAKPVEAMALVRDKADWVLAKLAELAPRMPFADGVRIPVRGVDHVVRHVPQGRGGAWLDGGALVVSGRPEHLARRLRDLLRAEARAEIAPRVRDKAGRLGRRAGRITVRDTKSRWGSCSVDGNLSFCWRLVMAPIAVLDYVVAHEVAHLEEANHGPRFWRIVAGLTADVDGPRRWLRDHGERLYRFG